MQLTRLFNQISKNDTVLAGGKGASLGEMTQAGLPVPPGFVIISTAFDIFADDVYIETTNLNAAIDSILHTVDAEKVHSVDDASANIQKLILSADLPQELTKQVKEQFQKLNSEYVAVRSSATAEDSASAAWAGQLDTFLNTTEDNLMENIKKCWASLFTPRAIFYRFEKKLHDQNISVAVVIQEMIPSETAGIAFSVHPVTEDHNQLIIEAGYGLGEAVVGGSITPDGYVVEKEPRRIIDKNINEQTTKLVRATKGGNEWVDIPKDQRAKPVLTDQQVLELTKLILKIEKHYGFPIDIEWAHVQNKFYITQSRPITTLSAKATTPEKLVFEKTITRDWPLVIAEMLHQGFTTEFNEQFNFSYSEVLFDFHSDYLDLYRAPSEHIEKMRSFILAELDNNPDFILETSKQHKKYVKNFTAIIKHIDQEELSKLTNKEFANLLTQFIQAHAELEPTFAISFWFPIQMEEHPDKEKYQNAINTAAKTRAETEQVGPEGDRIATKLAKEASQRMYGNDKLYKFLLLTEILYFLNEGKVHEGKKIKKRSQGFVLVDKE